MGKRHPAIVSGASITKTSNVQLTRHGSVDILISRDPGDGITHAGAYGWTASSTSSYADYELSQV